MCGAGCVVFGVCVFVCVLCVCVVCGVCGVCGVGCVVCGAAWHAENPSVCSFKTPPCVRSGRLRVYRQNARVLNTCGRVAGTH